MKTCKICGVSKPLEAFAVNRSKADGKHYNCKPCDAAKAKAWLERNREKAAATRQHRRHTNPAYGPLKDKEYYEMNKAKVAEARKQYYEDNREAAIERVRKYRSDKRPIFAAYIRRWRGANKGRATALRARRRVAQKQATPSWLTAVQKAQIQEFYEIAAARTMQTGVEHHVDHIHPLRGRTFHGLHVPWNLQVLTKEENMRKGRQLPASYAT